MPIAILAYVFITVLTATIWGFLLIKLPVDFYDPALPEILKLCLYVATTFILVVIVMEVVEAVHLSKDTAINASLIGITLALPLSILWNFAIKRKSAICCNWSKGRFSKK